MRCVQRILRPWKEDRAHAASVRRALGVPLEVVGERFAREVATLQLLPARRYDTSYWEMRQVSWDAYVELRGNRYSVPAGLTGRRVTVRARARRLPRSRVMGGAAAIATSWSHVELERIR